MSIITNTRHQVNNKPAKIRKNSGSCHSKPHVEIPPPCPFCGTPLTKNGVCTDCLYWDGGVTNIWMVTFAQAFVGQIPEGGRP